jgi:hypothetical protein
MTWLDVKTFHFENDKWTAIFRDERELAKVVPPATAREHLEKGKPHCDSIRLQITKTACLATVVSQTPDGHGCRIVGAILSRLIARVGGSDRLPKYLFLRTTGAHFHPRGLLTASCLCSPDERRDIYANCTLRHIDSLNDDNHKTYQARIMAELRPTFATYQELSPNVLKFTGVQSPPDGLFLNERDGELVVIEIKMREPTFEEGGSQVVQYWAQAKNHPRFRHLKIRTVLVAHEAFGGTDFGEWAHLMKAGPELKVFVDKSAVKCVS